MNNLWTDTGYISLNHVNEQLCGDRVEIIGNNEKSLTMVLADGLGSGVKANILSKMCIRDRLCFTRGHGAQLQCHTPHAAHPADSSGKLYKPSAPGVLPQKSCLLYTSRCV